MSIGTLSSAAHEQRTHNVDNSGRWWQSPPSLRVELQQQLANHYVTAAVTERTYVHTTRTLVQSCLCRTGVYGRRTAGAFI